MSSDVVRFKVHLWALASLLLLASSCAHVPSTLRPIPSLPDTSEFAAFTFSIYQDGKFIPIIDHRARLAKKPFTVVFQVKGKTTILLNASYYPGTLELAQSGVYWETMTPFKHGYTMASPLYNPYKDIVIRDSAAANWFYDNDSTHRFDEVVRVEDRIICYRNVEIVLFGGCVECLPVPLDEMGPPLYLVFITTKFEEVYTDAKELQRETLIVEWRD